MIHSLLQEASDLITEDRRDAYGPYSIEATKLAILWSAILGVNIPPHKIPLCMILLKLVRETNKHQRDNLCDIAGYTALASDLFEETEQPTDKI